MSAHKREKLKTYSRQYMRKYRTKVHEGQQPSNPCDSRGPKAKKLCMKLSHIGSSDNWKVTCSTLNRREPSCVACNSISTFDEDSVQELSVGAMDNICDSCAALMFKDEKHHTYQQQNKTFYSLCCSYGASKAPPVSEPPDILQTLLTVPGQRGQHFRANIRAYNSCLAFASMALSGTEYKFEQKGPFCFHINGQVYHHLSQLQPQVGKKPSFSQIYIYDAAFGLNARMEIFPTLRKDILTELQTMLHIANPFAKVYQSVGSILSENPSENLQLVLRESGPGLDR